MLHAVSACPFRSRWEWVWYSLPSDGPAVMKVQLVISSVRRPCNAVQLGHLHVYTGGRRLEGEGAGAGSGALGVITLSPPPPPPPPDHATGVPGTFSRIPPTSLALTAAGDIRGGGTGREFLANLHLEGAWVR